MGIDGFKAAVPPPGGFPPFPWDHIQLRTPLGEARVAVDLDGVPILDAEGSHVQTGPGFGHRAMKVTNWDSVGFDVPVEKEGLSPDACACLDLAYEISLDHGHSWVGTEHLALAVLRYRPGLCERFALPDIDEIEAAVARSYEGPSWEARIQRIADRRAGRLPRPPSDGPRWNTALGTTVRTALSLASGSEAGPLHLLVAEFRTGRALVLFVLEREGRDTSEALRRARTTRDWLPLVTAIEEAEGEV